MFDHALAYLIDVVFGLFTYALLLRFVMQALRAPFRNPLGQAVIALDGLDRQAAASSVLPGWRGVDWASLVATLPLPDRCGCSRYTLAFGAGFALDGAGSRSCCLPTSIALVKAALWMLIVVVFVQAILSWVAPDGPRPGSSMR